MMILVDPVDKYSDDNLRKAVRWLKWCHMVSDESEDELHQFALRIGLRPSWFYNGHYNLTVRKRREAVAAGAVEVTARELVKRNCVSTLRKGAA